MGDRDTRQTVRVLVGGLVVAVVAAWAYFARLDDQPWFADESAYIAQTYYYHLLFHEGDLWHEDWQRRGGIEVPPVPKYLFGLAMDLAGVGAPTSYGLTAYWYNVGFEPPGDSAALPAARAVSALAGTIACLALFALAGRVCGTGPAAVCALLWCLNPLVRMSARRAMGDGITECMVLLTVVLGAAVCRRLLAPRVRWGRTGATAALVALVGSLAINAKLNGAIGLLSFAVALVATWVWLVCRCVRRADDPSSPRPSAHRLWAVPLLGLGTAGVAFVLLCIANPFLLGGDRQATVFSQAARMVEHRTSLYDTTRAVFHQKDGTGLFTPSDKVWAAYRRGFGSYATLHPMLVGELAGSYVPLPPVMLGGPPGISEAPSRDRWTDAHPLATVALVAPVSGLLALAGLVLIVVRLRRDPTRDTFAAALPWLAYLGVTTVAVIAFIALDWDRYYIPLMAPWSLPIAVSLVSLARVGRRLVRRRP